MRLAILLAPLIALVPCPGQQNPPASNAPAEMAALDPSDQPAPPPLPQQPPQDGQQPVPEPSTLLLVGTGLVGLAFGTRLRKRRAADSAQS